MYYLHTKCMCMYEYKYDPRESLVENALKIVFSD